METNYLLGLTAFIALIQISFIGEAFYHNFLANRYKNLTVTFIRERVGFHYTIQVTSQYKNDKVFEDIVSFPSKVFETKTVEVDLRDFRSVYDLLMTVSYHAPHQRYETQIMMKLLREYMNYHKLDRDKISMNVWISCATIGIR